MMKFDATQTDGGPLNCYSCGREILDGTWFARIKHGGRRIVFCRPWCVEVFLDAPERQTAGRVAELREGG
jgi:hypothetical protein